MASALYHQHCWWDLQELKYPHDVHHRGVGVVEKAKDTPEVVL